MKPINFFIKISVLTLLNIFVFSASGQNLNDSIIYWDRNKKLVLNDFQGEVTYCYTKDAEAGCSSGMRLIPYWEAGMPNLWVFAAFNKTNSFVKLNNISSQEEKSYTLEHEQLHFDLTEIFARKVRKQVKVLRGKQINSFEEYSKIIQSFKLEWNRKQDQYDKETQNGINKIKQKEWANRILNELKSLDNYYLQYSGQIEEFTNAEVYNNSGNEKIDQGDYEGGIIDISKAIDINPKDENAFYNRGYAWSKFSDSEKAISDYTKAIELNRKFAAAYNHRANIKFIIGDIPGAFKDYDMSIELDPDNVLVYVDRGIAKFNLKDYKEAISDFSQAIKLDSKNADAFYYRGWSKIESGINKSGCKDLNRAQQLGQLEAPDAIRAFCE